MTKLVVLLLVLGAVFPGLRIAHATAGVPTAAQPKATWLAGQGGTTCAVRGGAVYCWGDPLGTRDLGRSNVLPKRVPGLNGVDSVSVSSGSACARIGDRLMCWGDNRWGQLGDGTILERREPVAVKGLDGTIEEVAAGQHHTCAIVDKSARCWGHGSYGQLGDGTKRSPVTAPTRVRGLSAGATSIALGIFTTCVVVKGHLECWGKNTAGELNLTPRRDRATPVDLPLAGGDFVGVRSSGFTTCAYGTSGITCWGDNAWSSPPAIGPISDLALAWEGGCVIRSGTVACFRWDTDGLTDVTLPAPATQISAGQHHFCALAGGEVYCWGNRSFGALGDGTPAKKVFDPTFLRTKPAPVAWPVDDRAP